MEYRDKVRAGRSIAVLAIDQLTEQARELCRKFQNIVPTMALGDYSTIPATLALFRPPGAPPASAAPRQPPSTPSTARSNTRGRQATPPATERGPESNRTAPCNLDGLLKNTAGGLGRPIPNLVLPHPITGTPTKLCRNHLYQGISCQWGSNCRLAHITSMQAVPPEHAIKIRNWVTETPDVGWTLARPHGQSP